MTSSYPWYSREGVAHGYQWYLSHAYNTITWFTVLKYIPEEDNECYIFPISVHYWKVLFMKIKWPLWSAK